MEILNFCLYFIPLLYFLKKKKSMLAIYIVLMWSFSAFIGIFYHNSDFKREGLYQTQAMPFIFLASCFYISLLPILRQKNNIRTVTCSTPIIEVFIMGIAFLAYEPFLEMLYNLILFIISGRFYLLGANYDDFARGESESLIQLTKWSQFLYQYFLYFKVATLILFFYYLRLPNRKKWITIGLFMSTIIPTLYNISIGSKTEALFYVISFIGFYLFLKDTFIEQTQALLRKIIICIIVSTSAVAIALSIGRYVIGSNYENSNTGNFLTTYTAESMYNFNENVFHENKPLHGFATMQPVLLTLDMTNVSMDNRRNYLRKKMQSPPHLFYNYIGDFVLDWGITGTVIIIILISYCFGKIKIREKTNLSNLFLYSIYVYLLLNGLFYFCYKSTWGPIYANLILYLITRLFEKKKAK